MFDRLDDLLIRYEELMEELGSPEVASDTNRFRKLMKEQSDLAPIVEAYKEYKKAKQDVEDSLALLDEESDEEMREMAKEELNTAKKRIEELEQELKILLLPKDPNDEKNVIVEIRAGAGGDEAALFASELYRMYVRFAERNRWKTELVSVSENGIGGFKEVVFMINGQGAYSKMKYESGVHRVQRVPETESGGRNSGNGHASGAWNLVYICHFLDLLYASVCPDKCEYPGSDRECCYLRTDRLYRQHRGISGRKLDEGPSVAGQYAPTDGRSDRGGADEYRA